MDIGVRDTSDGVRPDPRQGAVCKWYVLSLQSFLDTPFKNPGSKHRSSVSGMCPVVTDGALQPSGFSNSKTEGYVPPSLLSEFASHCAFTQGPVMNDSSSS